MTLMIGYRVIELFDDEGPECFGTHLFPGNALPKVGDIVMLRWLDGKEAYKVQVKRVDSERLTIEVAKILP